MSETKTEITVTRSKNYPCVAHPGPAWKWVYTVTIPGERYTFDGDTLSWVKTLCKSKRPDLPINYLWKPPALVERYQVVRGDFHGFKASTKLYPKAYAMKLAKRFNKMFGDEKIEAWVSGPLKVRLPSKETK